MKSRYPYIAIVIIACCWVSLVANWWVRGLTSEVLASRRYPQLLYGTRLPISCETTTADARPQASQRHWHLVLAFADDCPYCRRNRANWERLITAPSWPGDADVWLIPVSGSVGSYRSFVTLAQEHSVPVRVLRVRDRWLFPLRTGIIGVPATVIIDDSQQIHFVRVGEMSGADSTAFMEVLHSEAKLR